MSEAIEIIPGEDLDDRIRELYNEGLSDEKIGEEIGKYRQYVTRRIYRMRRQGIIEGYRR